MADANEQFMVLHNHVGVFPRGARVTRQDLENGGGDVRRFVEVGAISPIQADGTPIAVTSFLDANLPSGVPSPGDRNLAGLLPGEDQAKVASVVQEVADRRNRVAGDVATDAVARKLEATMGPMFQRLMDRIDGIEDRHEELAAQIVKMQRVDDVTPRTAADGGATGATNAGITTDGTANAAGTPAGVDGASGANPAA